MQSKNENEKDLKQRRQEIAFSICNKHPRLFRKLYSDKGYVMGEKEALVAGVLKALCELEPSIKAELEYYF